MSDKYIVQDTGLGQVVIYVRQVHCPGHRSRTSGYLCQTSTLSRTQAQDKWLSMSDKYIVQDTGLGQVVIYVRQVHCPGHRSRTSGYLCQTSTLSRTQVQDKWLSMSDKYIV